jgi:formate hydrogenlyase subunit 6/NADH:ubiquinone oxidoreductase subunit I
MVGDSRTLDRDGLQSLIEVLGGRGFTVLGPTVRDGSMGYGPIRSLADLPAGVGDEQDAAHYRLLARADGALFAYAAGAQSAKPVLFHPDETLWRSRQSPEGPVIDPPPPPDPGPPYALIGVRSCDLRAIALHDRILLQRLATDVHYAARRAECLIVAVTCTDPAGTCFCASMGTGPAPGEGYDIALTELYADGPHRFVAVAGTPRGSELLADAGAREASAEDVAAAARVTAAAEGRMGRQVQTEGLKDLLYTHAKSSHWDQVASRCLACTNCTSVCPTCFCTTVTDVTDLAGDRAERHRVWDSCFSREYSYIHGGSVRESVRSRYRQWITHKLASWQDQFGSSGCVGCGRCITWCPAGIDITAEVAALRQLSPTLDRQEDPR